MGCLRPLTIVGTISCNFLAMGWMVLVLLMGKTLGNAALIAKDDALFGLVLLVIALFGNALLALLLLLGRRSRRKPTLAGIELLAQG
jgi:membrane protein DedA with SNARE-associated domain